VISPESREEAVKRTGLRWDQIYKWLYDRRKSLKLPAPVFIPLPSEIEVVDASHQKS
jgi:hypothetical protein